jgi:lysophospholipase L1-like esterase
MISLLCYGDSNTWGSTPGTGERYSHDVRWPGVLQEELGPQFHVIEEGLNGRTTVWDDPIEGHKNGRAYLMPCLQSHQPLDLVILMLGTNDLKLRFSVSARDIAKGIGVLLKDIQYSGAGLNGTAPPVLLIAPPPLKPLTDKAESFEGGEEKSTLLADYYAGIALEWAADFLDAGKVIESSAIDGLHFEPEAHRKLALEIAGIIRSRFPIPG